MMRDPMETRHAWELTDAEWYARAVELEPRAIEDQLNDLAAALVRPDLTPREKQRIRIQADALHAAQRLMGEAS